MLSYLIELCLIPLTFRSLPAGTYHSLTDDQGACLDCPMNTAMDVEDAARCSCLSGFFKGEQTTNGPEVDLKWLPVEVFWIPLSYRQVAI